MISKNKKIILFNRLFIWILYLFSGLILYTKQGVLYPFLIIFTKVVYPLSIFWLQIRIKRKGVFLPIDPSMSTSQLWFSILPVLGSLIALILTIMNAILYVIVQLSNIY